MSKHQLNLPPSLVLRTDAPATMAKATIRKADELYPALGGCLDEVRRVAGLSLEEFAFALGKDSRQVARQIQGIDRPQLETVWAVVRFQAPLVIALARLVAEVEMFTEMRIRRTA